MKTKLKIFVAFAMCVAFATACEALVAQKMTNKMAAQQGQKYFKEVCSNLPNVTVSFNGQFMVQIPPQSVGACWIEKQEASKKEMYCGTTQTGLMATQLPQNAVFLGKTADGKETATTGPQNYVCENAAGRFKKENVYFANFPR